MKPDLARPAVRIRFALPKPELRPFITTYYRTDADTKSLNPLVEDWLHPEWPNLRFVEPGAAMAGVGLSPLEPCPPFTVNGPTSCSTHFCFGPGRAWGIGLMPLGWAALLRAEAGDYADRFVDGMMDPNFADLRPLAHALEASDGDFAAELAIIEEQVALLDFRAIRQSQKINAINEILVDPELATVRELAERVEMNVRSLERLCRRAFGFPPKLLLRRQRFLRSLAQFMLDPSMKWLSTLDFQYHDQPHFVRDFKRFMGMNPSAYAKLEKPLLIAAARARMEIAGEAVQGLHSPADPA